MIPPGDPAAGTAGNAPLQSHFHANVTSMKNWKVQLRLRAGIAVNMFGLGINPVFFPHSFGLPVLQLLLESPPELAAPISSKSMSGGAPAHPAVGIPSPHPSFCPLSQECHLWSIPVDKADPTRMQQLPDDPTQNPHGQEWKSCSQGNSAALKPGIVTVTAPFPPSQHLPTLRTHIPAEKLRNNKRHHWAFK